jgi:hypothetical protein
LDCLVEIKFVAAGKIAQAGEMKDLGKDRLAGLARGAQERRMRRNGHA